MLNNRFSVHDDISTIVAAIERDGYAIVEDAADEALRTALRADLSPYLASTRDGHEDFSGHLTKRIGGLLAKSDHIQSLLLHPIVIAAADHFLLPHCARYHLHYTGVIEIQPGEKAQVLHRDTGMFPLTNPCPPLTLATMWALNDFSAANGATRVVPGSHHWEDGRQPTVQSIHECEMPAGSVLIYTGNTLHGGGANNALQPRTGVALHYALGWLRQEENQYLAVPQERARELPEPVQEVMGYALGGVSLGFADRIDPAQFIKGNLDPTQSNLSPQALRDKVKGLKRLIVDGSAVGPSRYYTPRDDADQ